MIRRVLACLAVGAMIASPAIAATSKPAPKAAAPAKATPVEVTGAWIREAPPGAHALGGYLTIANRSKQPVTLMGVTSPLFGSVEMHNVVEEDGRLRMKQAMSFVIPAGESLEFKPRDRHFMLMAPKKDLKAGDVVPLELDFGKAGKCKLDVEVKRPAR